MPIQYLAVKRETDIQKKNLVTKGKMKAKRRGEMYKKGSATETGLSRGEEDSESQTGNRAEIGKKERCARDEGRSSSGKARHKEKK